MNPGFWKNRRVLLTGHTGFKGSWLSLWLQRLGAVVSGYAVDVPTDPSLYDAARVGDGMTSVTGDVRDLDALCTAVRDRAPEIVIHMAAQSLVRRSYADPVGTYGTNVMGTVNVLEAARRVAGVRVVLIVTSDKCYENHERQRAFVEDEAMGGHDPYSSSKGCAELVTAAYRRSYFDAEREDRARTGIASVRAGNVIGGGDWAEDRLIPDVVTALRRGDEVVIRNPRSVRPWQFVLDPLHGYLTLAERLWSDGAPFEGAWNFGPDDADAHDVAHVVDQLARGWRRNGGWRHDDSPQPHEAACLKLDSTKARSRLAWRPALDLATTLEWIVEWYRQLEQQDGARAATLAQIERFQQRVAAP